MPGYVVRVVPQGTQTPVDVSMRVLTFKFEDDEKKADKLTISVDNFTLENFDNPVFAEGNTLLALWGDQRAMGLERELVIKSVKGSTVLTVEALAKSVLMNQQRKTRIFEQKTYSAIAKLIAEEYGYATAQQHIEDSEIVWPCVTQPGVSDAVFLRHLANKLGWEWFVDWDGFHFHPRNLGQRPIRSITYYLGGEIEAFNVENDLTARPQAPVGAVQVKGRDPKDKKKIDVTADNTTTKGRDTTAEVIKVVDKTTGERTHQVNNVTTTVVASSAPTEAAAKQQAKTAFVKAQQRTAKLSWSGPGDANLVAKSVIELVFPGAKAISGRYYVTSVTHTLSAGEAPYKIEVKCRRDGTSSVGGGSGSSGATEAKTAGKTNDQPPTEEGELSAKKSVDSRTGTTTTTYSDSRGRG